MQLTEVTNSESAILTRVIQPSNDNLSLSAARAFLKFSFSDQDRDRMHELAIMNQSGDLTTMEKRELGDYLRVGRFLDLLGAKARLSLKKRRHDS